jgi:hypothetical protein
MTSENESNLLEKIKLAVEDELRNYKYPVSKFAIGTPWSDDKVNDELERMRIALVEPYWADVIFPDKLDHFKEGTTRRCVAIADNRNGYLVLYDPEDENYLLAHSTNGPLMTWGLTGDAVGCFLSI